MKTLLTLVGLTTSFLLCGCAHDTSSKAASKPAAMTLGDQSISYQVTVTNTGLAPFAYQWHFSSNIQSEAIQPVTNTAAVAGNSNNSWPLYIVDATNDPQK
jgi:hypothetical protein